VLFPVYLFLFSNTYRSVITSLMVLFSNNVHQLMLLSATRVAQASCMYCGYQICLRSHQPRVSRYHRHGGERSTQTDDAVTFRSTGKTTGCSDDALFDPGGGGYSHLPGVRSAHSRLSTQMQSLLRRYRRGIRELADYTYQRVEPLSLLTPGGAYAHP
jgi:hypothetical protein